MRAPHPVAARSALLTIALISGVLLTSRPAWSAPQSEPGAAARTRPLLVEPTRPAAPAAAAAPVSSASAPPSSAVAPSSAGGGAAPAIADPARSLAQANDAYAAGDVEGAAAGYRALIEAGHDHPLLHYDLGNAYLRQGELGRAIASYRRAAAGAPRDQDIAANLAYARKSAQDAVAPPEPPAVWKTVFAWHYTLSRAELWKVTIALDFVLFALLALRLVRRHEALTWAAAIAALLFAGALTSLILHQVEPTRVAVVLPREIDARAGNQKESVVRFKLHAGSEVVVRDQQGGWLRIALPTGEQGWIESSQAEVVEL